MDLSIEDVGKMRIDPDKVMTEDMIIDGKQI